MLSFRILQNHTREVNCCTFSKDFFVTCSGDKTIRVYSSTSFEELPYSPIEIFKYGVNFVSFNASGSLLASASSDGKAHVFQLSPADVKIFTVFSHTDVSTTQVCAFSHQSEYLVTGSADGSIALWDINKKKKIREISGHPEGNVYAAAFTPCDTYLVTGSGLGDIRVWDARTMQATMQTQAHDAGVSSCGVTCISFSPTFHSSVTDAERKFLMASSGHDNRIKLWIFKVASRALEPLQELTGHNGPVSFCCFSSCGSHLASSSFDSTVMVWNSMTGEQELRLDGHGSIVTSVAYSTTNYLASTSYDKKVIVWKISEVGEEISQADMMLLSPTSHQNNEKVKSSASVTEELVQSLMKGKDSYRDWSCEKVVSWLTEEVKMGQYSSVFRENDIDGQELSSLTSETLQNDLGITSLGHRNKIIRAIKTLQDDSGKGKPFNLSDTDLQNLNFNDLNLNASTVANLIKSLTGQPETTGNTSTPREELLQMSTPIKVTDVRPANDGEVPDQYLCPISREIMTDPVLAADGFTYERRMIESWFSKGNTSSPLLNKLMTSRKLIPNQTLRSLIAEYLEERQSKVQEWVELNKT